MKHPTYLRALRGLRLRKGLIVDLLRILRRLDIEYLKEMI